KQAGENLIVITELADVLTRDYGVNFRKAHTMATTIAQKSDADGIELYEWDIAEVNDILDGVTFTEAEWNAIIDPRVFVERRSVRGGTNPDEVRRMIGQRKKDCEVGREAYADIKSQLNRADVLLSECIDTYIR